MSFKQASAEHLLLHSILVKEYVAYNSLKNEIKDFDKEFVHIPESEFMTMKFKRFTLSLSEVQLKLVLLTHALLESTINYIVAQNLSSQEYTVFEKVSFLDKWIIFPKFLFENYNIDKSSQIYELLNLLNKLRNSIAHSKPLVIKNGDIVHKGNIYDFDGKEQEDNFFHRLEHLPTKLMEQYCKFDFSGDAQIILMGFKSNVSI